MDYIHIGKHKISLLGVGTFPLKGDILKSIIQSAVDSGYNLIDTAHKYQNEKEIGNIVSQYNNNKIYIETKLSATQLISKSFLGFNYSKPTPLQALKESCKKIGVKSLDIYLLHGPTNCVDLYGELIKLRDAGKIDIIGGCRMEIQHMEEIYARYKEYPSINQIELHPFYTNKCIVNYCREKGIVVEARSPFTHGDALKDFLKNPTLCRIASIHQKTVPQIILRWIIQQGIIAIPRSSNVEHIKENADIFDFCLTEFQIQEIDSLNQDKSYGCLSSK